MTAGQLKRLVRNVMQRMDRTPSAVLGSALLLGPALAQHGCFAGCECRSFVVPTSVSVPVDDATFARLSTLTEIPLAECQRLCTAASARGVVSSGALRRCSTAEPSAMAGRASPPATATATDTLVDVADATAGSAPSTRSLYCIYETMHNCGGVGRPPARFVPSSRATDAPLARTLAMAAELEAASACAFDELAVHLAHYDAPHGLVSRARTAAADERRHAHVMSTLALRRGGHPSTVTLAPAGVPTLCALAIANAREGEVEETYSALVATWQAETAADPEIRAAVRPIAIDERRHAVLAADIGLWATTRLPASQQRIVNEARYAATQLLQYRLSRSTASPVTVALGIPTGAAAAALFEAWQA